MSTGWGLTWLPPPHPPFPDAAGPVLGWAAAVQLRSKRQEAFPGSLEAGPAPECNPAGSWSPHGNPCRRCLLVCLSPEGFTTHPGGQSQSWYCAIPAWGPPSPWVSIALGIGPAEVGCQVWGPSVRGRVPASSHN